MSNAVKTIGVLTSGGDAPGMNAAIRAVVRTRILRMDYMSKVFVAVLRDFWKKIFLYVITRCIGYHSAWRYNPLYQRVVWSLRN